MPGRRVIVHAGFHKTGTSSAQAYLWANRKHIYPRRAMVLPGRLRKGAARMAVRYSRLGTAALLDQFGDDLRATLLAIEPKNRSILIADENLAGRMPGRGGHADYSTTPALMARAEDVICDVFGAETDVVFHFTTRAPESWLWSTYKHNLRASDLAMDWAEYEQTYAHAARLDTVIAQVAAAITGTVYTIDLETLARAGDNPARPLIDLMELPPHLGARLTQIGVRNFGPTDDLVDAMLTLNRAGLSDTALETTKAELQIKGSTP